MTHEFDTLVDRVARGDAAALELLLVEHAGAVRERLERRAPRPLLAQMTVDDLVQETFACAIRGVGGFRPIGDDAFLRWLLTVADNVVRTAIRDRMALKRGGGRRDLALDGRDSERSFDVLIAALSEGGTTPGGLLRREEAVAALRAGLGELLPEHREAVVLRYVHGLPVAEVARQLGRTESALNKVLARAVERLRGRLAEATRAAGAAE